MSQTLREVLDEYAVKHHARIEEERALREEWLAAIRRLLDQCRAWLEETDKDKLLNIRETGHLIAEEKLGRYEAPGLGVILGSKEVILKPGWRVVSYNIAMNFSKEGMKTAGRAEIAEGIQKIPLYRILGEDGEYWRFNSSDFPVIREPLTKESFDRVMAWLLG